MFFGKLWELFLDSFPKILLPGLTMTIPLTAISFTLALIIAVAMALVQFANVPVLRRLARFYIWIFRGTPLLVQLFIVFYGLSRVGIVLDREEKYNFSTPYAFNRTAVLVRGDYDQIHSMEDLKGKRTANTISSNYAALAESYGATVTGVDDLNQTIELLLSGRIDATLNAEVVFADYQRTHPDANIQMAAFSDEPERVAIPVRKGAPPCWRPSTTLWPRSVFCDVHAAAKNGSHLICRLRAANSARLFGQSQSGPARCAGPDLTFRKPCVTIWLQLFMRRRSIMSEVKKGSGLVYKNHPLRRIDNLIYYGSMADKYIVLLQILDTKKEQDMDVATRVSVQLQMTDPDLKSRDRVVKKSEKDSLYAAMDVGCIWLERALAGK